MTYLTLVIFVATALQIAAPVLTMSLLGTSPVVKEYKQRYVVFLICSLITMITLWFPNTEAFRTGIQLVVTLWTGMSFDRHPMSHQRYADGFLIFIVVLAASIVLAPMIL